MRHKPVARRQLAQMARRVGVARGGAQFEVDARRGFFDAERKHTAGCQHTPHGGEHRIKRADVDEDIGRQHEFDTAGRLLLQVRQQLGLVQPVVGAGGAGALEHGR